MTRNGAFLGLILFASALVLLQACAVFSSDPAPAEAVPGDEVLYALDAKDAATVDLSGNRGDPATEAEIPQEAQEEGKKETKGETSDIAVKMSLREQRVRALVAKFVEEGKKYLDRNMLDEAQEQFAHAMELDPGNGEVRDLFNRVSALLGKRPQAVAAVAAEARDKLVVRRAQNRMKAEELLKKGKAAMDAGDFEEAVRDFEDALLIVRWNPYLDEGVLEEGTLQGLLKTAKDGRDRQKRERELQRQERVFKELKEQEKQEQEFLANRIRRLFEDANTAYMNNRYKECEVYLDELLKLDPTNEMAKDLKELSMQTRHTTEQRSIREEYKRQWRATMDDLEFDDLPQTDLLQFPSDEEWERIAKRGRSELASAEEARNPEDEAIFQKLRETPVSVNFEQASLQEVVDYFKATTGVNFLISPTITESGEEPVFDLVTPPRPALDQLETLLENSLPPLKYTIKDGVVKILAEEDPSGEYILDVYDVRDLVKTVKDFPAKDFNLTPSQAPEELAPEEEEALPDVIAADALIELIQSNIEPSSWEDTKNSIAAIGNFLVVRQSRKVHQKINKLLEDLRASAGILVNIETRFLAVEDDFLRDVGVDWRGLDGHVNDSANPLAAVPNVLLDDFGDGSAQGSYGSDANPGGIGTGNDAGIYYDDGEDGDLMGRLENLLDIQLGEENVLENSGGTTLQFTYLDDTALEVILRAVEKSKTANIIQAPSLTVYNGERGHVTMVDHVSYLKDFDSEIAQSAVVAEPVIAVVKNGIILDVKPVVSSDRRFITMELRPTVALLKRDEAGALPQFTTGLGVGESITIELPEMEIKRLRTTVTIPDGATLLLGGMKISTEQKFDTGLPFFKYIPIVSFLISRKAEYETKRKLLILVTAKIVIPEEKEPKIGVNK